VLSNRGIDVNGAWVDKILVPSISLGQKKVGCSQFLDEIWRAAEAAQKKRTDQKAVQEGHKLPSLK
jgi:hypothetical protein